MTHYQEWLIENKVVYVKFWDDITVEEIGVAFAKSNDLSLASQTPPVHFLHNWGEVTSYPKRLHELRRLTKTVKGDSRRIGWVVVFGTENMLMRFLGDVFFQMFRVRFRMFLNEAEAIDFLQRIDSTLPDFPELPFIPQTYRPPEPVETQTAEAPTVIAETQTTEATQVSVETQTTEAPQTIEAAISSDDTELTETEPPSDPDENALIDTDPPSVDPYKTKPISTVELDDETKPIEVLNKLDETQTAQNVDTSSTGDE